MKKNVFAIITTLILVISIFASVPVMADEATASEIGGLDFYSITIHYENPILVSLYETKIEVVAENGRKSKVDVEYFYNTDAETEEDKYMDDDESLLTDKVVISSGTKSKQNFYQVSAMDGSSVSFGTGLWYAKVPYTNAFLTHIVNNSAITTTSKIDFYGITDPYDDAPYEHQNPNIQYADDGYALSTSKDENGNQLKIDVNGYLVDTLNNIWKTSNNERVELYTQIPVIQKTGEVTKKGVPVTQIIYSEVYEWVSFSDRLDENGKIKNIQSLEYMYMVTDEEFNAFLEDDSKNTLPMYRTNDADVFGDAPTKGKEIAYVKTCLVDSKKDSATYWSTDRVFTQDDIVKDEMGFIALATPSIGVPVLNAKIKDITVEFDALGSQIYDDLASDPQQKNTFTVSINDCEHNAKLYKQWFDEGLYTQAEYDEIAKFVLGTGKSKTTRTEIDTDKSNYKKQTEYGYSTTVASVSIGASPELLAKIPISAKIYVDFDINEQQPEAAWDEDYQKKMISKDTSTKDSTVITEKVEILTDADKPAKKNTNADAGSDIPWPLIIGIAAGVVVVAAAAVVIVVILKKKKSA